MSEQKETQLVEQPDFESFYHVVSGYVEYCIRDSKAKLTAQERNELSESEIAEKEGELRSSIKKLKKEFLEKYDELCANISKDGVQSLQLFVEALKKLYEEKSTWKKDISSVLTNQKSLRLFREVKSKNLVELYPILLTVNKTFQVNAYPELSLEPKAALCGSEIGKDGKNSIKKMPLKDEEIQAILEMFAQVNDIKRLGTWLIFILEFSPNQVIKGGEDEYGSTRMQLKEWAYTQIYTNDSFRSALTDALERNKKLNNYVDAFVSQSTMKAKLKELEERKEKLKAENEKEKTEHEDCCKKQSATISELRQKIMDFDRCKQQLTDCMQNYQLQIAINERITADNKRRIKAVEEDYDHMQDELSEKTEQLESLQTAYTALQSDFSLKNNELQRLKEMFSQKGKKDRIDLLRELVMEINEQFYYLTMFYLDFKDTGTLAPESIELYGDTINKIFTTLTNMGAKKIGEIDQKVPYDAAIHNLNDSEISNGEQVVVTGYGWMINNEIFIKVPVEKGE